MVIMHNLEAMNGNRMLGINDKKKASVTEKLASGYQINRAADDAAGLAISEKMRRQIRGLSQASLNAQDGISLIQLADGAMDEIHEMLQRGNELCVKAANGTLTEEDRKYIQEEIEHLEKEIDALSNRTDFNEIKVLKGGQTVPATVSPGNAIIKGGFPSWATVTGMKDGYMSVDDADAYVTSETFEDYSTTPPTTNSHSIKHPTSRIDFSDLPDVSGIDPATTDQSKINTLKDFEAKKKELIGQGFYTTCCSCSNHYSIRFTEGTGSSVEQSGQHYIYNIGIDNIKSAQQLVDAIIEGTKYGTREGNPQGHYTKLVKDPNNNSKLVIYDIRSSEPNPEAGKSGTWAGWGDNHPYYTSGFSGWNTTPGKYNAGYGTFGLGVAIDGENFEEVREPICLHIQIGSEAGQHLEIELPEISSLALGVDTVDVTQEEGPEYGIAVFKKAIQYVNTERSRMGAYQNRLEHTTKNLDNVVENTAAAESRIRDADMAKLMVDFSNLNILQQAGQSMLAQANQSKQGVLSLLQ